MTQTQAAKLQAEWKQKGDLPPPCEHRTQVLAYSDDGYLTGMHYCLTCGEAIDRASPVFPK